MHSCFGKNNKSWDWVVMVGGAVDHNKTLTHSILSPPPANHDPFNTIQLIITKIYTPWTNHILVFYQKHILAFYIPIMLVYSNFIVLQYLLHKYGIFILISIHP